MLKGVLHPYIMEGGHPIDRPISSACIMTPFFRKSTPNDPVFHYRYSPHQMTPFQNFNVKFQIFRVLRVHFENFQPEMANFQSNLTKITLNDPLF